MEEIIWYWSFLTCQGAGEVMVHVDVDGLSATTLPNHSCLKVSTPEVFSRSQQQMEFPGDWNTSSD